MLFTSFQITSAQCFPACTLWATLSFTEGTTTPSLSAQPSKTQNFKGI